MCYRQTRDCLQNGWRNPKPRQSYVLGPGNAGTVIPALDLRTDLQGIGRDYCQVKYGLRGKRVAVRDLP